MRACVLWASKKMATKQLLLLLVLLLVVSQASEDGQCAFNPSDSPVPETEGKSCGCGATNRDNVMEEEKVEPHRLVLPLALMEKCKLAEASDLLSLPGGQFTMGTLDVKNEYDGEGPPRQVLVNPFELEETEVSILQFCRFVVDTGHVTDAEKFGWSFAFFKTLSNHTLTQTTQQVEKVPWWVPVNDTNWLFPNGPDLPIQDLSLPAVHVSHHDARAYCSWLGRRLPTEAEFEFAMRGGKENQDYPWGKSLTPNRKHRANLWQGVFPDVNTKEDGFEYAAPVDAFGPQNDYGVHNIVGNVWEWVQDAWVTNHEHVLGAFADPVTGVLDNPQIELDGKMDAYDVERIFQHCR
ncbi:hypothetical protein BASA81_001899 [Batrachochytrium salamandrivorans]|nr:hypothetical protein BASA81_001899 [Batrachochytrium salamandrivorans]